MESSGREGESGPERAIVPKVYVTSDRDWDDLRARTRVVVDPMVFRTADVFLRGGKKAAAVPGKEPESVWQAISANTGALCTFFDLLILEERLPLYDYDMTFPPEQDIGMIGTYSLVTLCNQEEELLLPVTVREDAYQQVKRHAVETLQELPDIPTTAAKEILDELSAFDHEWRPDLWRGEKQGDERERALDAFRFGGLLFSGYAQRLAADHILQPKRARLYLAASLQAEHTSDEAALFAELTRLSEEAPEGVMRTGDLPRRPTLLPYLLKADDNTPQQVLQRALKLRRSGIGSEYREWWKQVREDLDKGRSLTKYQREISRIAAAVARELRADRESKVTIEAKVSGIVPTVGASAEVNPAIGLGWLLRNLPGHRYRKLLMRMVIARREYWHLDRHLGSIWHAA